MKDYVTTVRRKSLALSRRLKSVFRLNYVPQWPLTPLENAQGQAVYAKSFHRALANSRILNIAVTGAYGAGKSTFLRSFFMRWKLWPLPHRQKVLWVSLANFQNAPCIGEKKRRADIVRAERWLELNVLQQILSVARPGELPCSRIERIAPADWWRTVFVGLYFFLLLACSIGFFQPKVIVDAGILDGFLYGSEKFCKDLAFFSFYGLAALSLLMVSFVWRAVVQRQMYVGVDVKGVRLGLDRKDDSVFNRCLGELIYFFQVKACKVVVFEDLDRFNDTHIFSKLRELNHILNQAQQIRSGHKPIRFIYAVRDDLFANRFDRTKFFDYILPIVPILNGVNARNELANRLCAEFACDTLPSVYKVMVDTVAPFISDMRLLNNICNEFFIYRKQFEKDDLREDRLLGMIVFKNFFPHAFWDMLSGRGFIAELLQQKKKLIDDKQEIIRKEIDVRTKELNGLSESRRHGIHELNERYVAKVLMPGLPDRCHAVRVNGECHPRSYYFDPDNLSDLVDSQFSLLIGQSYSGDYENACTWSDLEKRAGVVPYAAERTRIEQDYATDMDSLRRTVSQRRKSYDDVSLLTLKALCRSEDVKVADVQKMLGVGCSHDEAVLVHSLIRIGCLSENYSHYTSVFCVGRLTRTDHQFEFCVYKRMAPMLDLKLVKVDAVANDIDVRYFSTPSILNYTLAAHLIAYRVRYKRKLREMGKLFHSYSTKVSNFVCGTLAQFRDAHLEELMIDYVMRHCPGYLDSVIADADVAEFDRTRQVGAYLRLVARKQSAPKATDGVKRYVERLPDVGAFCHVVGLSAAGLEKIIKRESIQFRRWAHVDSHRNVYEVIYRSGAFKPTREMLNAIGAFAGVDTTAFTGRWYTGVHGCADEHIRRAAERDWDAFVRLIYDDTCEQQTDPEEMVLKLLNDERIKTASKELYVKKLNLQIDAVEQVVECGVLGLLLRQGKVKPTWHNYSSSYDRDEGLFAAIAAQCRSSCLELLKSKFDEKAKPLLRKLIEASDVDPAVVARIVEPLDRQTVCECVAAEIPVLRLCNLLDAGALGLTPGVLESLQADSGGSGWLESCNGCKLLKLLKRAPRPYCELSELGGRPAFKRSDDMEGFVKFLDSKGIVSSVVNDGRQLRVNMKKVLIG